MYVYIHVHACIQLRTRIFMSSVSAFFELKVACLGVCSMLRYVHRRIYTRACAQVSMAMMNIFNYVYVYAYIYMYVKCTHLMHMHIHTHVCATGMLDSSWPSSRMHALDAHAYSHECTCHRYARLIMAIKVKTSLSDESVDMLQEILSDDEGLAKQVCAHVLYVYRYICI
jgi:hypothetical protein